jgi:hypothetical protein
VGEGFNTACVHRLHAVDHLQDVGDAVQGFPLFGFAQVQAGQMGNVAYVLHVDCHVRLLPLQAWAL